MPESSSTLVALPTAGSGQGSSFKLKRSHGALVAWIRATEVYVRSYGSYETYDSGPDQYAGAAELVRFVDVIEAAMIGLLAVVISRHAEDTRRQ